MPTRAEQVRDEARRILSSPQPQRVLAEMLVHHDLVVNELSHRVAALEAMLAPSGDQFPKAATGKTRKRAT